MKSRAWWPVLAALACVERPPELPEEPFDVDGSWSAYFWTDAGAQRFLNSHFEKASVAGLEPTGTSYRAIPGTASAGTFRILGLSSSRPLYYLKIDQRFSLFPEDGIAIWELPREVNRPEFRWDIAGRRDVAFGSSGVALRLDVRDLDAWTRGSSALAISSATASLSAPLLGSVYGRSDLAEGAAAATDILVEWASQPLIAAGDITYIHQLSRRIVPAGSGGAGLEYQAATRYAPLAGLQLVDGIENTVAAPLVPARVGGSVAVDIPVTEWERLRGDISPVARTADVRLFVSANPYVADAPAPLIQRSGTPDLARMKLPPGNDVSGLRLEWGRFYDDASWREIAIVQLDAPVRFTAPGASQPLDVQGFAISTRAIKGGTLGRMAPEIGPPLSPTINGRSLFDEGLRSIGTTPRIAWNRPRLGTPTRYVLEVYELSSDATGATKTALVLTAVLSSESFLVPTEILTAGRSYFVSITARTAPYDGPTYLGRQAFPFAAANCVSAVFVP